MFMSWVWVRFFLMMHGGERNERGRESVSRREISWVVV